jgi:hypothetical protein
VSCQRLNRKYFYQSLSLASLKASLTSRAVSVFVAQASMAPGISQKKRGKKEAVYLV